MEMLTKSQLNSKFLMRDLSQRLLLFFFFLNILEGFRLLFDSLKGCLNVVNTIVVYFSWISYFVFYAFTTATIGISCISMRQKNEFQFVQMKYNGNMELILCRHSHKEFSVKIEK